MRSKTTDFDSREDTRVILLMQSTQTVLHSQSHRQHGLSKQMLFQKSDRKLLVHRETQRSLYLKAIIQQGVLPSVFPDSVPGPLPEDAFESNMSQT